MPWFSLPPPKSGPLGDLPEQYRCNFSDESPPEWDPEYVFHSFHPSPNIQRASSQEGKTPLKRPDSHCRWSPFRPCPGSLLGLPSLLPRPGHGHPQQGTGHVKLGLVHTTPSSHSQHLPSSPWPSLRPPNDSHPCPHRGLPPLPSPPFLCHPNGDVKSLVVFLAVLDIEEN